MRRTHIANHDHVNRSLLHTSNGHLSSVKDNTHILKECVVEINNNEIGDASDGVRCFVYAHDEPNGKARSLFIDSSHNLKVKDDDILTEATSTNTKLVTTNSHLEILKDTVVEINNNEIGDASDGVRCFVYGHDEPNGKARSLFLDSSHNLKVKDDDILTEATSTNTKLDTANSNLTNLKNAQEVGTMDANNTRNIGDGSSVQTRMAMGYDNDNGKVRSIDVDSDGRININVLSSVAPSGVSTEAKQDIQETSLNAIETLLTTQATHNSNLLTKSTEMDTAVDLVNTNLTTIDTAVDLNNTRGDELYMDTHVAHISNGAIAQGALLSASGGSEIDMLGSTGYQYRDVTIYGKTTTAGAKLHFAGASSSGGSFYYNPTSAQLQVDNAGTNYHFIMTWENCPFRYVDVYGSTASAGLYLSSIKSKHR